MTIRLHRGDLPDLSRYKDSVAIDTETMGLNPHRDRLCVVQMSNGDGSADVIQIPKGHTDAPNLKALLANPNVTKIFHFARFDLAALYNAFGVMPQPVYCTKIASRLSRTYTDRHGLKDLVREVLNIDLSKQQQSICMPCASGSTPCSRAKAGRRWRRPVSISCRPGPSSISAAGRPRTSSRIRERDHLKRRGTCSAPFRSHS